MRMLGSIKLLPLRQRRFRQSHGVQRFQQIFLPVKGFIRRLIGRQRFRRGLIVTAFEKLPRPAHHRLIGGRDRFLLQEEADGLSQPLGQILQRSHGRLGCAVFDLRQHISGDLIAAELPLG